MTNRLLKPVYIFIITCMVIYCRCSSDNIAGGGTEDVNTMIVIGKVLNPDGSAASHAQVQLIPADYDPIRDSGLVILKGTTDNTGEYRFALKKSGNYNAQIVQLIVQTRAMISNEKVQTDTTIFPPAVLSEPGKIKVTLPENADTNNGYIYIPGTIIFSHLKADSGYLVLDSVPANAVYNIVYSTTTEIKSSVLRFDVPVKSKEVTTISNPGWSYCQTIVLNTTATGAGIAGDVYDFPVLIRLNQNNFDFTLAKVDGSDLNFTKKDNSLLSFEIERWDPIGKMAEIWVQVDTIWGNNINQYINMYWGNKMDQVTTRDTFTDIYKKSYSVFDTASGFQGVWHFSEPQGDTLKDATINNFYGLFQGTLNMKSVEGLVGFTGNFDGMSNYVTMPTTVNSKLNYPENGTYSLSAWIYIDTIDNKYHEIVSKSNQLYGLQVNDSNLVRFYEYSAEDAWNVNSAPAIQQEWHLLTGVKDGEKQYLYIDGICVDNTNTAIGEVRKRVLTEPLCVGNRVSTSENGFFKGYIDEVRIHNRALSADWIKLCFENQCVDEGLVEFR